MPTAPAAPTIEASRLLRPGLLDGAAVLLAGASADDVPLAPAAPSLTADPLTAGQGESVAASVRRACAELGARVSAIWPLGGPHCDSSPNAPGDPQQQSIDEAVAAALAELGAVDLLLVDAAGLFAHGAASGEGERRGSAAALRSCLDGAWNVTRAVVTLAYLARGRGGRIIYLAPPAGAGEHAGAALAGLENLARTLSIEWARHAITTVAIAPGDDTPACELAALCAYLASPAGAYFSGCLLDLSSRPAAARSG
jgi:NAD(P)-dependent dehydrogenase (short-subunit alcohol dehydrogenase family)